MQRQTSIKKLSVREGGSRHPLALFFDPPLPLVETFTEMFASSRHGVSLSALESRHGPE